MVTDQLDMTIAVDWAIKPQHKRKNNSLMCPLNDGIFYFSESATHQDEYFLKHDHHYVTINTWLSM